MNHQVTYKNAPSDWNEALPLGNSVFGGMTYFRKNKLTFAMNHYEVYYKTHGKYSKKYRQMREANEIQEGDGSRYKRLVKLADDHYSDYKEEAVYSYFETLFKHSDTYGHGLRGVSHMPTGEVQIGLAESLKESTDYSLRLLVEQAKVELKVTEAEQTVKMQTWVAQQEDLSYIEIEQTHENLVDHLVLSYPKRRYQRSFVSQFQAFSETTFGYTVSFAPYGANNEIDGPFQFIVLTTLEGAKGQAVITEDEMTIKLVDSDKHISIVTHVLTEEQSQNLIQEAQEKAIKGQLEKEKLRAIHQKYWNKFFNQSRVTLPDKFLENLWYINLYALGCCSGKNGKMYPDASGLNGLWDIKQPNIWGSSWYWDVNIQATYWPVYTANHLELSEVFVDALLFYTWDMEKMAKESYGVCGYAMDYPHALYNSVLPWCAQWLWWHYEYSGDKGFLREKAYPFFKKLLQFIHSVIRWDDERKEYYFYPEVSPEQGPLTRNSTITLATVKYLIEMTLQTVKVLQVQDEDESAWRDMLEKLPAYPLGEHPKEGTIIRDSEYAMPDLHLRHPSLLMPIYPIGEINQYSEAGIRKIAENTLRYVEKSSEIGVFIFGWLACAAARMGKGDMALRVLYQRGIDHMLRPNGLCAEETERWNNFCTIGRSPLYYPCIMEATGEIIATVNEMLLQSYDGAVDVFPALPKGEVEKEQLLGIHQHNVQNETLQYGAWENCSFQRLLAKGGIEVTSEVSEGKVQYIYLEVPREQTVWIRQKAELQDCGVYQIGLSEGYVAISYEMLEGKIRFDAQAGGQYLLATKEKVQELMAHCQAPRVSEVDEATIYTHQAHTYRRIFVGKDADTDYIKALDSMTFEYCLGNVKRTIPSTYRFDFGTHVAKDYSQTLHRQVYEAGKIGSTFEQVTPESIFSIYKGYGFKGIGELRSLDRDTPDELRRDFIEGTEEITFIVEVTKGKYDLFVVCGDEAEASYTQIEVEGILPVQPKRPLKAGEYFYETIPFMVKEDKYLEIKIRTIKNQKWKLNYLVMNRVHGL